MFRSVRSWRASLAPACAVLGLAGCLPVGPGSEVSLPELVLSWPPPRPPAEGRHVEAEPNDDFNTADPVYMDGQVEIVGDIAAGSSTVDRDVYELGPADAGDHIKAKLSVDLGNNVVFSIMDDQSRLVALADPGSLTAGPREIDIVLHEPTSRLFAVVAARSGSSEPRVYTTDLSLEPGADVPEPRAQVLVLDFQGGSRIRIGSRSPIDIPPFDAANIGDRYAGYTEAIIDLVLERVSGDYAGLDVSIYSSDDAGLPEGEHSVIYFGTYDDRLLGLADNIDPFNADASQAAVIYTDTFSRFSILSPAVEQISQALANVASHEAGHLLGLRHTADPQCIMDITASARQMMLDQWFTTANLDDSVLPIGVQDAPALLSWTVGGSLPERSPEAKRSRLQRAMDVAGMADDFYIPRRQLMTCFCAECAGG